MQTSREQPGYLTGMNIINTVTQLLLGAVSIAAIMYANEIQVTTSLKQHIYLCVCGYIILMSQAILSISPFTGWSNSFKYQEKRNIHWIMQIGGAALAIAGSSVRIAGVNSHFTSAHGFFGIFALVFTCLSLIGGVVNLYSNNINMKPNTIKICHSALGCITLTCAFLCLIFGFDKTLYRSLRGGTNANMLISFTVFALVGTLLPACTNLLRRIRN